MYHVAIHQSTWGVMLSCICFGNKSLNQIVSEKLHRHDLQVQENEFPWVVERKLVTWVLLVWAVTVSAVLVVLCCIYSAFTDGSKWKWHFLASCSVSQHVTKWEICVHVCANSLIVVTDMYILKSGQCLINILTTLYCSCKGTLIHSTFCRTVSRTESFI